MDNNNIFIVAFFIFSILGNSFAFHPNPGGGGIAFSFSGAGGRISQHLALMESLIKGTNPTGIKVRPNVLSGASSGAISAIALNAILYTEDHNVPNGFDWDTYKELIFSMTNDNVYDTSVEGIAEIFTYNVFEGYFLDNSNLEQYLMPYLQQMNLTTLGDLYLPTEISVVNQTSGDSLRLWSNDPQYSDINLMEIIMASTAMPIAFPPALINGLGNDYFIDGGTGIDTLPVYGPLHDAQVDEIYVICYGGAFTSGGALDLPLLLQDILILKNTVALVEDMRVDLFNGGVDMLTKTSVPAYLYMPNLNISYSSLEFDDGQQEYEYTKSWTFNNPPTIINTFKKPIISVF